MSVQQNQSLMTGHRTIDMQHQDLFDSIADLKEKLDSQADLASLKPLLQSLQQYVLFHLSHEETLMRKSAVTPDHVERHLTQHIAFADEVARSVSALSQGEAAHEQLRKLLAFLQSWLVNHIQGTDKELVRQLNLPTHARLGQ